MFSMMKNVVHKSAATMTMKPLASCFTPTQFRLFTSRIFVQGIPVEWDENEINARFSLVGPLSNVHFVKNSTG